MCELYAPRRGSSRIFRNDNSGYHTLVNHINLLDRSDGCNLAQAARAMESTVPMTCIRGSADVAPVGGFLHSSLFLFEPTQVVSSVAQPLNKHSWVAALGARESTHVRQP
jgi:hypothetical protein